MNKKSGQTTPSDRDEETMARLLQLAGPRSSVPDEVEARVYERVHSEWQAATRKPDGGQVYANVHRAWRKGPSRRRVMRWAVPVALAASVLLAVGLVMRPGPEIAAPVTVARVVKLVGFEGNARLADGQDIAVGARLSTRAGEGISLQLVNAASLRIDENSVVTFDGQNHLTLVAGRIYADTGDFVYRNNRLVVDTPFGAVTDIGTRFAVAAGQDALDIAVRDGRVDLRDGALSATAVGGERMQVSGGQVAVDALAPHDSYWHWTASLAPAFDIENKSLLEFLRWATRETGLELEFADDDLRMAAMRTDLHGSVTDLEPLDAIVSVLATTRFRYRIEHDRLIVER